MGKWKQLSRLIGPLVIILILIKIDRQKLLESFQNVNLIYLCLGILGSLLQPVLRSMRWNLINRSLDIHLSFYESLRVVFIGFPLAMVTPGRIGMDFYRFSVLKKLKFSAPSIIYGLVLDRFYDLLPLALFFCIGIGNLKNYNHSVIGFLIPFSLLLMPVIYILVRPKNNYFIKLMEWLASKCLKEVDFNLSKNGKNDMKKALSAYETGFILSSSFLALFIWVLCVNAFALSLGEKIPFFFLLWCVSVMVISNYLPISFLGIGTRDVTLIYLLSLIGISSQQSVGISSLVLVSLIIHAAIGGAFFLFSRDKLRLVTEKKTG